VSEANEGELEPLPPLSPKRSGTARRVLTVAPLIPLLIIMMFWGWRWLWHAFVLSAIAIGGSELMAMKAPSSPSLRYWGAASSVLFASAVIFSDSSATLFGVLLLLLGAAMVVGLLADDPLDNAGPRVGWLLATPIYVGGLLCSVDLVRDFPPTGAWVLLAMVLAWLSDTFAYFAGRKFGKTKLAPRISPKKTVEGAMGGLLGSLIGGIGMSFFIPALPILDAAALAIIAGIAGQAGDLFESVLKRSAGVKDSGGILPGHGGILDRTDALMFTASATWAYGAFIAGF
jgi:phosphatidate cytidylyltransferase